MTYSEIHYRAKAFHIQKDGNLPDEYEDAYDFNEENSLFALADGASESVYSGRWAKILVTAFTSTPFDIRKTADDFLNWLEPLQKQWREEIDWSNLRWYVEEKARRGAFSTFLALQIRPTQSGKTIDSIAIGDTCLFVVRNNNLVSAFPVNDVSDFGNTPDLLCSYERYNSIIRKELHTFTTDIDRGDLIVMASDALAKWILEGSQNGNLPWSVLQDIDDQPEFEEFIGCLKESKKIRNDDVTVAIVYFE